MLMIGLVRRGVAPLTVFIAFVERWEGYQIAPEDSFDAHTCCHEARARS